MTPNVEEVQESNENTQKITWWARVKSDYKIIKENLKIKVVYRYYIYWLLASICPSFVQINYYLLKDVYAITSIQYGVIYIFGTIAMFIGVTLYQLWFKKYEIRNLFYASAVLGIIGKLLELLQVKRININFLGISDMVFLVFSTTPIIALQFALTNLPSLVLF